MPDTLACVVPAVDVQQLRCFVYVTPAIKAITLEQCA